MGPAISEPWVSAEDVAVHVGVAKDTVYRWLEARTLPGHRVGRLWKFKLSEVDEWVRAGHAADAAPPPRLANGRKKKSRPRSGGKATRPRTARPHVGKSG